MLHSDHEDRGQPHFLAEPYSHGFRIELDSMANPRNRDRLRELTRLHEMSQPSEVLLVL